MNYLQKVTPSLALGAELQYQHMSNEQEYSGLNFGGAANVMVEKTVIGKMVRCTVAVKGE